MKIIVKFNFFLESFSLQTDSAPQDIWLSYYGRYYKGDEYNRCRNCDLASSFNDIYVYAGIFIDNRDGAVNISKDDIQFLHSSCYFYKCRRNDDGGAIYFRCNSSIVQPHFCAIDVCVNKIFKQGLYCYIYVKNSNKSNLIIESSICQCSQNYECTIYIDYGNIGISASNVTKNTAKARSAICSYFATGLAKINLSIFENNFAYDSICLEHGYSTCQYLCCNVINNSQGSTGGGIFRLNTGTINIENSTIQGGNGNAKTFLCLSYHDTFNVDNCKIDNCTYENGGTYNIELNTNNDEFFDLQYISNITCEITQYQNAEETYLTDHSILSFMIVLVNKLCLI